jgi:hypothetical protein
MSNPNAASFDDKRWFMLSGGKLCWLCLCLFVAGIGLLKGLVPASAASYTSPLHMAADGKLNGLHGNTSGLSSKPIEKLQIGDTVLAYDFETKQLVPRKVLAIHRNFTYCWVHIALNSGTKMVATRSHPFWVENERDWIEAQDLCPGMHVRLYDGQILTITDVNLEELQEPQFTFNITVETDHNYFAGSEFVLTHNTDYTATDYIIYRYRGTDGNWYIGRTRLGSPSAEWNFRYESQPRDWEILRRGLNYEQCRGLEQRYIEYYRRNGWLSANNERNGVNPLRTDATAVRYRDAAKKMRLKAGC